MTTDRIPGEMDPRDEEMKRATDLLLDLIEKHLGDFSVLALFTAAINAICTVAIRVRPNDTTPAEIASFLEAVAKHIRAGKATPYTKDQPS